MLPKYFTPKEFGAVYFFATFLLGDSIPIHLGMPGFVLWGKPRPQRTSLIWMSKRRLEVKQGSKRVLPFFWNVATIKTMTRYASQKTQTSI